MNKAIGGYFGLELPGLERVRYQGAMYFQSARACFHALLQKGKPSKVWLPYFNCDAFLNVLIASGIEYSFYSITEDFLVEDDIQLSEGEWLVYVNYFGICDAQCDAIIRRFGSDRVLLDHAQAYFCPPKDCLATIYSPRKFFGVPDGGVLISRLSVDHCSSSGSSSYERTLHLLKRFADSAESGYSDYQSAERALEVVDSSEMSSLSKKLLFNADADTVIEQRNRNFMALHEQLKSFNQLDFDVSSLRGPLCYPF
ncbi:hypothetical protein [Pseudomonas sp. Teo4]|uniref:hypothetical protein n=1 Tax=Pseudomonas sp. Teo4 TaxID=3064528 RepID=UPI002ABCFD15|nr:hypothetical protein [Pseudomonas sp. Teo4]MDZ3990438.1 hypothetical protein [Pseudomonas sp. Teo4]